MLKDIVFESQHTSWNSLINSLENWSKKSLDFQYAVEAVKKLGEYTLELEEQNKRLKEYWDLAEKQNEELSKKYGEINTQLSALLFTVQMKEALVRDLQKEIKDLKTKIK